MRADPKLARREASPAVRSWEVKLKGQVPPEAGSAYFALVRRDGAPSSLREALARGRRELALYLAAGAVYVAIGIAAPEFLFTWVVATGYLLLVVVALPFLIGRLRR
jgi:hypothetical protein